MKRVLVGFLILSAHTVLAYDERDGAVLASPMVKAIQSGLKKEQGLKCIPAYDESRNLSVRYYFENNISKFELFLNCETENGLNAVIKGVIGDSGQTAVESFKFRTGIN